ncbi:MAG: ankyrin repeat domain-containing protein, partial [Cytophagales bacterium]|nr:ankyrin repeat domain-containing protein [Cytophagales bacterium]
NTPLMSVSGDGNVEMMQLLLAAGAEVNTVGGELASKCTALHYAAFEGRRDAVELLLKSGADKDAADERSQTPLHKAAFEGHLETVKLLVENDANMEAESEDGSTVLLLAVGGGRPDVVAFLLKKGANRKVTNECGYGVRKLIEVIEDLEQREAMKELLDRYENKKE